MAPKFESLEAATARRLASEAMRLRGLARTLHSVSPLATVARGYAILQQPDGRVVRSVLDASPGDRLDARLSDGNLSVQVQPGITPGSSREPKAGDS